MDLGSVPPIFSGPPTQVSRRTGSGLRVPPAPSSDSATGGRARLDYPNIHDKSQRQLTRVELSVDEDSGRVYGRVVDQISGKVLEQLPNKEMLKLVAKTRELLDTLTVDKST